MSADPLQFLFQMAHSLRPAEFGHTRIRGLELGSSRSVRLWWTSARYVRLQGSGSVQVGTHVFRDMEEVAAVRGNTALYRPPGYGRPLLIGRTGRRVHIYRFFQARWYELTNAGPKVSATDIDWHLETLKPLPIGKHNWLPVPPGSARLTIGALEDDGAITLNNPACERIPYGAKALYVTPTGDVLRSAGSEVTAIGELLPRPEVYYRKQLRMFAYRDRQWVELVAARPTAVNTLVSRRDERLNLEPRFLSEAFSQLCHPNS